MRLAVALGQTIRIVRTEQFLTLRELAAKANCSIGHVSEMERAIKAPTPEMLENLSRGFGISTIALLNRVIETLNKEEQQCSQ